MPFGIGSGKQNKQQVDKSKFFSSYPIHNPSVISKKNDAGDYQIEIPLKKPPRWMTLFATFPEKKTVQLDTLGSFVWELCDGKHMVQDIINELADRYKLTKAEAAASLDKFLFDLGKRGLIFFSLNPIDETSKQSPPESITQETANHPDKPVNS